MAKYRGKDIYLSPQINLHAIIDQEYNGESEHAQSGKAVAQALASKADKKHNHGMEDVTGLSDALAAKADNSALGNYETTEQASAAIEAAKTELQGEIDKKADLEHTHNYAGSETAGGIANYANALAGFSKTDPERCATWGNQDGELITGQICNGAEIQFRGVGDEDKALNVLIDGYFYQDVGRYKVLDSSTTAADVGAIPTIQYVGKEYIDNTAIDAGFYSVEGEDIGLPNGGDYTYVIAVGKHKQTPTGYCAEIAIPYMGGIAAGIYMRISNNTVWGEWTPIYTGANKPAVADITGLTEALAEKSANGHQHAITDVTGLQEALSAASGGGNLVVDQTYNPESTNAQSGTAVAGALTGYAVVGHTHSDYALKTDLDSKAPAVHTHQQADIEGLEAKIAELEAKITDQSGGLGTETVGGATRPIYIENGVPKVACDSSVSSVLLGLGAKAEDKVTNLIVIGNARASTDSVAIGRSVFAGGTYAVAIGNDSTTTGKFGVAVGNYAEARASNAIQLGNGTNSTAGTFQVFDKQLLDANGKIPLDRFPDEVLTKLGLK